MGKTAPFFATLLTDRWLLFHNLDLPNGMDACGSARAGEARALLRARFASPKNRSLKELLADAPLDGIDVDHSDDLGREVEL
jgi:hypothetical protein